MIDQYQYEERISIIQFDGGFLENDAVELANRELFPAMTSKPTAREMAEFSRLGWSPGKGTRFVNRRKE